MTDEPVELPGMEGLDRVVPPFEQRQPKYRVTWRLLVTGSATFTTWDWPDEWLEDEDNTAGFYGEILDDLDSDVDYDDTWTQVIEVQQEDGGWAPVGADLYARILAHQQAAGAVGGPDEDARVTDPAQDAFDRAEAADEAAAIRRGGGR